MGQWFEIVDLDRMESWDGGGGYKMGEFMYDTNPALLRCLVADSIQIDEIVGRWAGDRIICIGDGAMDLPPGVITEEDQWLVDRLLAKDQDKKEVDDDDRDYDEDEDEYYDESDDESDDKDDNKALGHRLSGRATSIRDMLNTDSYKRSSTDICPPNSVWALRSLSKKEFVRSDKAICGSQLYWKNGVRYPFDDFPGLFQVLIFRTGWSANPSCAAVYNAPEYVPPQGQKILMNEGTWAGDRIDMVRVTDDGVELINGGWKDVSRDACTQMRDIFHAEDCIF